MVVENTTIIFALGFAIVHLIFYKIEELWLIYHLGMMGMALAFWYYTSGTSQNVVGMLLFFLMLIFLLYRIFFVKTNADGKKMSDWG